MRAIRASVIRLFRGAKMLDQGTGAGVRTQAGIRILNYADLTEEQRATANSYFQETVFPTLTPLAFDPGRPFPHISNLSLNLAVMLRGARRRRALRRA